MWGISVPYARKNTGTLCCHSYLHLRLWGMRKRSVNLGVICTLGLPPGPCRTAGPTGSSPVGVVGLGECGLLWASS